MAENSDDDSTGLAILLVFLAIGVIAYPFVKGLHSVWILLSVGIGMILLVMALAVLSPSQKGEYAIFRRGG